jgi:hypothetical protein
MHAHIEQLQRQAEENRNKAIRQMLNATDEQWQRIKPQLDRIKQLETEARVSAEPGSSGGTGTGNSQSGSFSGPGFGGSWGSGGGGSVSGGGNWAGGGGGGGMGSFGQSETPSQSPTSGSKDSAQSDEGRVLCNQLLRDLQTPGTPPQDIAQRVAALRRIRTEAQAELALARTRLRTLITPAQEPALVVMGYLD